MRFLKRVDAANNPKWYNKTNNKGITLTEEVIDIQKENRLESLIERYGVTNSWNIEEVRNRCKKSLSSEETKENRRKSNLENLGVENPFQLPHLVEASSNRMQQKTNRENVNKIRLYHKKGFKSLMVGGWHLYSDEVINESLKMYEETYISYEELLEYEPPKKLKRGEKYSLKRKRDNVMLLEKMCNEKNIDKRKRFGSMHWWSKDDEQINKWIEEIENE